MTERLMHIQRGCTFTNGEGIIDDPKTASSKRYFPIDERMMPFLEPIETEGFVVDRSRKGNEGEHFTQQAAECQWDRIKEQIDVHGITPYCARHTYATNLNRAGVTAKTGMGLTGHSDERMLLRVYMHTDIDDVRRGSNAVAGLMSAAKINCDPICEPI